MVKACLLSRSVPRDKMISRHEASALEHVDNECTNIAHVNGQKLINNGITYRDIFVWELIVTKLLLDWIDYRSWNCFRLPGVLS